MKRKIQIIVLIVITGIIGVLGYFAYDTYQFSKGLNKITSGIENIKTSSKFQSGDIIFQSSKTRQSKAIQLATNSKNSHMGIIYKKDGEIFVYEAVQPVKLTLLKEWIKRGEKMHFVVKRIKNAEEILTQETLEKLLKAGEKYKGKNYDIYFEWSDEKIYCSELVWKMYKEATGIEIGKLQKLSEFDLSSELVKKIMKERYGENIPLDEIVISPISMFESEKLVTVIEK